MEQNRAVFFGGGYDAMEYVPRADSELISSYEELQAVSWPPSVKHRRGALYSDQGAHGNQ